MDAKAFVTAISDTKLRSLAKAVSGVFETHGCQPYVKTIYLGYALDDEMVAAIYPHAKIIEVALALPEDVPSSLLTNANHLTWPTMPVAAVLSSKADLPDFR